MATNPTNSPTSRPKLESLTHVDITKLSQSELHDLSLSSASAFDLRRTDDLVIPKIDRSIFNESAGSRRQTYSRLRPAAAPRKPHQSAAPCHHRRLAGLLPDPKPPPVADNDPERYENKRIVNILKQLIQNSPFNDPTALISRSDVVLEPLDLVEFEISDTLISENCGEKKRKRGRKPMVRVDNGKVLDIVNREGVVVDLEVLANMEDPYGEELGRRTAVLETEEEFLGFLRDLEGQWGSRRRKRKIVNASDFGGALPVGWKLLLGLRRREGRVSLYCRRYVSPSGQQFVSCKEASSYLQFYFGQKGSNQQMDLMIQNIQQPYIVASGSHADMTHNDENLRQDIISSSSLSGERQKEIALLGIGNLAEVQVLDLFECHKCNMTFDEKDTYLQHLLSSHQKTTRRYRLGTSVGDGVIVRDGKYECQFCHKIFQERRRYNGHVGNHVKSYIRRSQELPGQITVEKTIKHQSKDCLQERISKMDALIEIAQTSFSEASLVGGTQKHNSYSTINEVNAVHYPEIPAAISDHELKVASPLSEPEKENNVDPPLSEPEKKNSMVDKNMDKGQQSHMQDIEFVIPKENAEINTVSNVLDNKLNLNMDAMSGSSADEKYPNGSVTSDGEKCIFFATEQIGKSSVDGSRDLESHLLVPREEKKICDDNGNNQLCSITSNHPDLDAMDKLKESGLDTVVNGSMQQSAGENEPHSGIPDSSMLLESLSCFPMYNSVLDKGEGKSNHIEQKFDNVTGFEELKLDDIDPYKFSFMTAQESAALPDVPMDMGNDVDMEVGFDSSVQFNSEEVLINMDGRSQLSTVCVWCRNEFNHEPFDSQIETDSVGFMCPTCKAKISGQLNVFNSDISMNPHCF